MKSKNGIFLISYRDHPRDCEDKKYTFGFLEKAELPLLCIYMDFNRLEYVEKLVVTTQIRVMMNKGKGVIIFPLELMRPLKRFISRTAKKEWLNIAVGNAELSSELKDEIGKSFELDAKKISVSAVRRR